MLCYIKDKQFTFRSFKSDNVKKIMVMCFVCAFWVAVEASLPALPLVSSLRDFLISLISGFQRAGNTASYLC